MSIQRAMWWLGAVLVGLLVLCVLALAGLTVHSAGWDKGYEVGKVSGLLMCPQGPEGPMRGGEL